jgi:hypothetical protein
VRDCFLKFGQCFPVRRIGQRIAEMIGCENGRRKDEEEDSEITKAKDHGLDFRLFNTMLGEC